MVKRVLQGSYDVFRTDYTSLRSEDNHGYCQKYKNKNPVTE